MRAVKRFIIRNLILVRNLAIVLISVSILTILMTSVILEFQPIKKKGSCVGTSYILFPKLFRTEEPSEKIRFLIKGNELFVKRMFEYYLKEDWVAPTTTGFTVSPVSIILLIGIIAIASQPSLDYSYEEMKMGLDMPCSQSLMTKEMKQLFKITELISADCYLDPRLDVRVLKSLLDFKKQSLTIARQMNIFKYMSENNERVSDHSSSLALITQYEKELFRIQLFTDVYGKGPEPEKKFRRIHLTNRQLSKSVNKIFLTGKDEVKYIQIYCDDSQIKYIEELRTTSVTLKSKITNLTMVFLLPGSREGWNILNERFTIYDLDFFENKEGATEVHEGQLKLELPLVEIENEFNLRILLEMFNVISLFQKGGADYRKVVSHRPPLTDNLRIRDVQHKARFSTRSVLRLFGSNYRSTHGERSIITIMEAKAGCELPFFYYTRSPNGHLVDFGRVYCGK